jgi:hypothetical protein
MIISASKLEKTLHIHCKTLTASQHVVGNALLKNTALFYQGDRVSDRLSLLVVCGQRGTGKRYLARTICEILKELDMRFAYIDCNTGDGGVKTQHYLLADLLKQLVGEPASGLSVQDMQQRLHAHLNEEEMDPVTLFVVHPATQATDSIEFLADIKSIAEGTKKMAIYALFEEGSDAEESLVQSPGLVNTRDVVPLAPCMTTRRWHATPPRQLTMSSPLRRGNFVLH